ncbi:hypothetical protein ZIOFF_036016 [Zingiber officinale]|uniref:Uncharacterized protein n=1 Tax=Zingiber officinale TaxID=94328 RepID=A0A8J5GHZ8_ZINOF|nr:hypothetical protein ZIOFF_036016 [Zingiber officinale]
MTFMTFEDDKEESSQEEVSSEDDSSNGESSSEESSSSDDDELGPRQMSLAQIEPRDGVMVWCRRPGQDDSDSDDDEEEVPAPAAEPARASLRERVFHLEEFVQEKFRSVRQQQTEMTTATGDMHRASTQLPPTSDEERELEEAFINRGVSSYVEVVDDENEDVGGEPNNRRHRSTESTKSHRRKDPKRSKTEKYDAYMDKWSDTLQHLSQESIARQKYLDLRAAKLEREQEISSSTGTSGFSDPYSIDMCMQILNQMDDLSTQVYTKATEAFGKPWLREVFMKIPSNRRAEWLDCINLDHV